MRTLFSLTGFCLLTFSATADPRATQMLNDYRVSEGHAPLVYSTTLEVAAAAHAQDMAARGFFDHTGSDGSTVGQRVTRQGYRWCFVAENIAQGQASLSYVMQAWATSPGHQRNMVSDQALEFALIEGPGRIWVMVLAAPGC